MAFHAPSVIFPRVILPFLLFAIASLSLIYFYTGVRLIRPLVVRPALKKFLWSVLILLFLFCFSPFIVWIGRPEGAGIDLLFRAVFLEFGLFTLLFPLVLTRDLLLATAFVAKKLFSVRHRFHHDKSGESDQATPGISLIRRREFLVNGGNAALFGVAASFTGYGLFLSQKPPEVTRVTIPLPTLHDSFDRFTIAQISDLHVGPFIKRDYVEEVVKRTNALGADLIVITGDIVDGSTRYLNRDVEPLAKLHAPHGLLFCTGNHEYYSGVEQWIDAFNAMGIRTLLNEHILLQHGKSKLLVAGVTDLLEGKRMKGHESDPVAAIQGSPADVTKIVLAHQPRSIFAASKAGFDFQISGHTHGGQYFPYTRLIEFVQPYVKGLYRHNDTWLYVNRGSGYWGPPLRTGHPGEITLFELKKGS